MLDSGAPQTPACRMNPIDRISHQFEDNMRALARGRSELLPVADRRRAVELITASLLDSGKVLVCGSSGSAGDARRFAAQLVNGFGARTPRRSPRWR